jgi:FlaA1/EpsC-like NDP-sugar epimerase
MGQPVRIKDMAEKMIRLYGLRPHQDVKIEFTGLRPGEKLYEELLTEGENILHTHHSKIKIAQLQPVLLKEAKACLASLEQKVRKGAMGEELVQVIKEFVPEFLSNNSEFEVLDGKVELEKAV